MKKTAAKKAIAAVPIKRAKHAMDSAARREMLRLYLEGMSIIDSYLSMRPHWNGNRHSAYKEAHLIFRDPGTQALLEEMRADMYEKTSSSMNEWLASNLRTLRFDPSRLYDQDGNLLHPRDMDRDTRMCLQEVVHEEWKTIRTDLDGKESVTVKTRTVKVKYRSPDSAEERLGKYHGAFKQDNEQKVPRLFDGLSRELQQALYERLSARG